MVNMLGAAAHVKHLGECLLLGQAGRPTRVRFGSLWLAFKIIFFDDMPRSRDPHNLAHIQLKWLAIFVIELRKRNRVRGEVQLHEQSGQLLRPIGVSLQGLTSAAQADEDLAVIPCCIRRQWRRIPEKSNRLHIGEVNRDRSAINRIKSKKARRVEWPFDILKGR